MQEALFYGFSLERHVPNNHLLRKIDRFVDLSEVTLFAIASEGEVKEIRDSCGLSARRTKRRQGLCCGRVPRGPRIDLLSTAVTTAQAPPRFRDRHALRQGVDVYIGLMPAGFACCDNGANAVYAHIGQRHRRPRRGPFSRAGSHHHATARAPWITS
jgi:hypothetical protein